MALETFVGEFDIEFIGDFVPRRIHIRGPIVDYQGHNLYLLGEDETIYNWTTIISIKKIEEETNERDV